MTKQNQTPRYLWLFWAQGAKHAPIVVKHCIKRWKALNPGWKVVLLDNSNVGKFIKIHKLCSEPTHLQMAHQSDLIRLQLLHRYGGVWADATTYCRAPLDDWIDDACQSGFFAFHQPAPDRVMSNWFLASHKGNPIPEILFGSLTKYFKKNKEYPYFIFHLIFEELANNNHTFSKIWQDTPKISAVPPHLLFHAGLVNPITDELKQKILESKTPMFKLSWKVDENQYNKNTILYYLLNSDPEKTK